MSIEIHLTGDMAAALKDDAEAFLQDISQGMAEFRQCEGTPGTEGQRGDAIAIAALILAVPGAVVATLDLAQRARLSQKIQVLLEKIRETRGGAVLHTQGDEPLDLKTAIVDEVLARIKRRPKP